MLIGGSYDTSAQVTGHAPGTALYVTFPTWTALARGNYAVSCSTRLTGDQNPYNDRATASGRVRVLDVSADSILRPVLQVTLNDTVYPLVLVSNHGTDTARFSVAMEIGSSWRQARGKTLAAGAQDTAGFPKWIAQPLGKYFVGCSLFLAGDMLPGNNKIGDSVTVAPGTGISRNAGPTTPSKFALYGAQPNPTRDQAQIRYDLAEAGFSRMAIYDTRGRLVCELVAGQQASGHYQIAWNCRDAFNRRVAPGVYFCRLLAGSHQATSKVLIAN
jgi:hypothetical protein